MIKYTLIGLSVVALGSLSVWAQEKPNIILMMADDLGWGDTGYNGNKVIKTPHLDRMAAEGLRMDRFYSASAVCSPTRASCLTGRNPYRTGVFYANTGILRPEEITLPEILQEYGYATGHFGKWHLGTLTTKEKDANRGKPGETKLFNPPSEHGYGMCFVTESKVPTYDPMKKPKDFGQGNLRLGWAPLSEGQPFTHYGTHYWDIEGKKVNDNLDGDDSRVIMDRVLPFIDQSVESKKPFIAVVWFHTPHLPCVAGPRHQEMYKDYPLEQRNYAGCVTAMDEQIGRLRAHLAERGVADNTMIWFCSDNGPEGKANGKNGSAADFTGRKRSLHEGGVRVPGLLVWPKAIPQGRVTSMPCVTSDYLPTVLDAAGITYPEPKRDLDGESLLPMIQGKKETRNKPISLMIGKSVAMHDGKFKLLSQNGGKSYALYNLETDQKEKSNLAEQSAERIETMKRVLQQWHESVRQSFEGEEYGKKSYDRLKQKWQSPLSSRKKKK
ncbi:sulfatase-like hydrolase/transferase [Verrucomicrobiaceae bacterium N1E253]|uniref:Sulfatase-like hydrolase/transferase n=1 Tax=Oceaniferula marina TaxID=2748318 RepID=A0A851GRB3_9BACT|nr:sulfatase-like hydrolase/transferase [Oceaniferula marina]NWK57330.1 sulfatase-like hydrolase/transferase [Oceaniferula marina]